MPIDPQKILARRAKLGISQAEAARRAGMSQPFWSAIESGTRAQPSFDVAEKIADALGVKIDRLRR